MTVSTQNAKVVYQGNGSTTAFTVPFRFVRQGDLKVVRCSAGGAETALTLTTDYVVAGAGQPTGGTCVLNQAPAGDETLAILRDPDLVQETDYQENDAFPAETHEAALDLLTMIAQANRERIDRALKLPLSSGLADPALPWPEAGRALVWNQDANSLANGPDAGEIASAGAQAAQAVSAAQTAVEARNAAELARDEAEAIVNGRAEHVSYDNAFSGLGAATVQDALDELAEDLDESAWPELVRQMELGFFQLAENQSMTDIALVNKRIDTFEDAANIDAVNSTGYAHEDTNDLVRPLPGSDTQEPDLSAATHEDVKGAVTTLTVDTADASGHFDSAAGAKVLAGCRLVIAGTDYPVVSLSGDGTGTDAVAFDGALAEGAHTVQAIHGTVHTGSALALSQAVGGQTLIPQAEGGVFGSMTGDSGNAAAFDGDSSQTVALSASTPSTAANGYVGKSWASPRTVTGVKTWGTEGAGYADNSAAVNMWLYGGDSAPASALDGVNLGVVATGVADLQNPNPQEQMSGFDTSTPYLYHWLVIAPVSGSWRLRLAEVEFWEDAAEAPVGQLYTVALPAISQTAVLDIVGAAVTDDPASETLVYAVSVDNGSTVLAWDGDSWEAVSLDSETGWMDEAALEGVADADWPAPTDDIIVYAGFKTATATANPSLSVVTMTVVGQVADMDLVMEPVACTAAPATARVFAVLKDVDALTLNTDLKAWASRDDGAHWDQIALTKVSDFLTDRYTVEGTLESFTHAEGGADEAVFRISSENHKDFELRFLSQGVGV